jgi:hypothetical protein
VLAQDVGQPGAGLDLLKKGMYHNPERWQLPFDLGFLHFIELKDDAKAARYFKFASQFEDSPAVTKRFTAFAFRKAGQTDVAKALWEEIYRTSSNQVLRDNAEYALKSIYLDEAADTLTALAVRFRSGTGRFPGHLEELVQVGMVRAIPPDPFGGAYFWSPSAERALSTTRVIEEAENKRSYLERLTGRFFDQNGAYPASLADLAVTGLISEVPEVEGASLRYDPQTGSVDNTFEWEEE